MIIVPVPVPVPVLVLVLVLVLGAGGGIGDEAQDGIQACGAQAQGPAKPEGDAAGGPVLRGGARQDQKAQHRRLALDAVEEGLELVPQPGRLGQKFLRGLVPVKFGEVIEKADIGRGIRQPDVVVEVGQHPPPSGRMGAAPQTRRLQGEEVEDGV